MFGFSFREFIHSVAANIAATGVGSLADMIGFALLVVAALTWGTSWHRKRITEGRRGMDSWYFIALAGGIAAIAIFGAAYGIGLRSVATSVAASPTNAAFSTPPSQLARLRVHYTSVSPTPEIIEADNVLKPMSFQFVDGGNQQDPKSGRNAKWTLLILTFDKPVTGESVRVLFEGGDIPHERKNFTPRNVAFLFEGSVADKTIQIEVRP